MSSNDFDACVHQTATPSTDLARSDALALLSVCLASLSFGLEISSVPVILPTLDALFRASFSQLQWIMNAYSIACATVLMATGTLADRFGRKRVFVLATALFGASSLLCGFAGDAFTLILARALQGASGGAMLICVVAVLSHQFPPGAGRSRAFGAWGIATGVGLGFGPLIGGTICALANWRWVFWAHVAVALIVLALARTHIRESRDPQARSIDIPGMAGLSAAVFGIAWFITQGQESGLLQRPTLIVLALGFVGFVLFLFAQRRAAHPLFDFSVFRIRAFSGALFGSVAMNCSFWPFIVYLPIYFQSALGYDAVKGGLALLAYTLPTLVFPPLGERLSVRFGVRIVIPGGLLTIGLGFFAMNLGSSMADASWLTMLPGCLLAGAGLGLVNTPVTNTTTGSVQPSRAGMASGIDMSARMISLTINIALMGMVLAHGVLSHLRSALGGAIDDASLHVLARRFAAGEWGGIDADIGRTALASGFGDVMLYGAVAACLLAAASFVVFFGAGSAQTRR